KEYRTMQKAGYRALAVMEQQLTRTPFLVGDAFSIADIALYAYTHEAHQAGFDLETYPAIRHWLVFFFILRGYFCILE
ncbi:glutathione S-transferase C-terminal domain-containing protein, partial [Pseudomonas sp. CCI1.1]|uniref:glutathione S-transferase C-terminal domain-containing protein n=1 Tax=Pseudomonas sp. CCI1.1 TaxID=3048613 RepID=UPI002B238C3F